MGDDLVPIATAVLGCGVIGASWATAFRAAGQAVRLWDPNTAAAHAVAARHGDRVIVLESPEAAVEGTAFVQENGPEDLAVKHELFRRIGAALGPHALVASSTSTLQASELQDGLEYADRLLVGHPFNPPHILPLVEVVGGKATAEWAIEEAMRFYAALGKHPIRLRVERPGHLANRLQAALWREFRPGKCGGCGCGSHTGTWTPLGADGTLRHLCVSRRRRGIGAFPRASRSSVRGVVGRRATSANDGVAPAKIDC
jgi:3-hydroxyacyl-CoA dehydrogenase